MGRKLLLGQKYTKICFRADKEGDCLNLGTKYRVCTE